MILGVQELLNTPVGEVAVVLLIYLANSVLDVFGQVLIIIHEGCSQAGSQSTTLIVTHGLSDISERWC